MRRILLAAIAALAVAASLHGCQGAGGEPRAARPDGDRALTQAFERHERDVLVEGRGVVLRLLADDREGSRHQRFILRLASGRTVLVAHNIDLARPIAGLERGDTVAFRGEYEWNAAGGVIHWTHADPAGRHPAGWIEHDGVIYR
jgi:hypothetical protein